MDLHLFETGETPDGKLPIFIRIWIILSAVITLVIGLCLFLGLLPVLVVLLLVQAIFAPKHNRYIFGSFCMYTATCFSIPVWISAYLIVDPLYCVYNFITSGFDVTALTKGHSIITDPIQALREMSSVIWETIRQFCDIYKEVFE